MGVSASNQKRVLVCFLIMTILLSSLSGCTPAPVENSVTAVALDRTTLQMSPSDTAVTLVVTVSPDNAQNKMVYWASANSDIATVNQDGQVTAVAEGSTVITVTSDDGGFTDQCMVTVSGTGPASVSLGFTSLTLTTADSPVKIEATVLPDGAGDTKIQWTSSNPLVAQVDQTGMLTPLAKGATSIQAKVEGSNLTAECNVTVTAVLPEGIALDRDSLKLLLGSNPVALLPTVLPSNAENKSVLWSSSAPGVASVDSTGKVTPISEGVTTITARTVEGGISTSCDVTVVKLVIVPNPPIVIGPVKATGIAIDRPRLDLVTGGLSYKIQASIVPAHATNKKIIWTSSNTGVAVVDANGNVSPVAKGNAVITAATEDGGYTAHCPVEVGIPNVAGATIDHYAAGSMIAFQGEWIYFTMSPGIMSKSKGIYKIRTDGSAYTQLANDVGVYNISVVGDWVYYGSEYALYRVKIDGTERMLLNSIDSVYQAQVIGTKIYYLSRGSLYTIGIDGKNRAKVSDESYIAGMLVVGDQVFYTKSPASGTALTGLYRMKLDGTGRAKITSDKTYSFTVKADAQTVYYIQLDDLTYPKGNLYSIRANGSSKKILGNDNYWKISLQDDNIFYTLYSDKLPQNQNNGLYRMRIDGTLSMLISATLKDPWSFFVNGDYVYFKGPDALFRVNKDGTGEIRLK